MVKIVAESREEYDELDGLTKKLFKSCVIDADCAFIVQKGILNQINISPYQSGAVRRIYTPDGETCSMSDATSDYIVLVVDNQEYRIQYKPKE